MLKKALISVLLILTAFFLLASFSKPLFAQFKNTDTLIHRIGCRAFEFNTISVFTEMDMLSENLTIKVDDRIVYENGRRKERIGQHHGHTIFNLYYQDRLIAEIGHFKTNNWHCNGYYFWIFEEDQQIAATYRIEGPDARNDSFQKRYLYGRDDRLEQIEFRNDQDEVYRTEPQL